MIDFSETTLTTTLSSTCLQVCSILHDIHLIMIYMLRDLLIFLYLKVRFNYYLLMTVMLYFIVTYCDVVLLCIISHDVVKKEVYLEAQYGVI